MNEPVPVLPPSQGLAESFASIAQAHDLGWTSRYTAYDWALLYKAAAHGERHPVSTNSHFFQMLAVHPEIFTLLSPFVELTKGGLGKLAKYHAMSFADRRMAVCGY